MDTQSIEWGQLFFLGVQNGVKPEQTRISDYQDGIHCSRMIPRRNRLGLTIPTRYHTTAVHAVFLVRTASLLWLTQRKLVFFLLENRFCIGVRLFVLSVYYELTGTGTGEVPPFLVVKMFASLA